MTARSSTVGERQDRQLGALQVLLDQDRWRPPSQVSKTAAAQASSRSAEVTTKTPLPAGEAVGLQSQRAGPPARSRVGPPIRSRQSRRAPSECRGAGENPSSRLCSTPAAPPHASGPKALSPMLREVVDQPRGQRRLGADDGQVDALAAGVVGQACDVQRRNGARCARSAVARRHVTSAPDAEPGARPARARARPSRRPGPSRALLLHCTTCTLASMLRPPVRCQCARHRSRRGILRRGAGNPRRPARYAVRPEAIGSAPIEKTATSRWVR